MKIENDRENFAEPPEFSGKLESAVSPSEEMINYKKIKLSQTGEFSEAEAALLSKRQEENNEVEPVGERANYTTVRSMISSYTSTTTSGATLDIPRGEIHSALVVTSDPQYPRYLGSNDDRTNSEKYIQQQYNNINNYIANTKLDVHITINGDLTEFGHDWQLSKYHSLVETLNAPYFPGLGNHDIQNNFQDCYCFLSSHNCCQLRMLNYMRNFVNASPYIDKFDYYTGGGHSDAGSWAYTYDLGSVYCIQLQNFPTMNTKHSNQHRVHPDLTVIDKWMKDAKDKGKAIIVHVHKPDSWLPGLNNVNDNNDPKSPSPEFIALLKKYEVDAVFCGHYHYKSGEYTTSYREYFGGIPVFLSGAADYQTYLIAEFGDEKMNIYLVNNNNWSARTLVKSINLHVNYEKSWDDVEVDISTPYYPARNLQHNLAGSNAEFVNYNRTNRYQAFYHMYSGFLSHTVSKFYNLADDNGWALTGSPTTGVTVFQNYPLDDRSCWSFDPQRKLLKLNRFTLPGETPLHLTLDAGKTTVSVRANNFTGYQNLYLAQRLHLYTGHNRGGSDQFYNGTHSSWNDTISSISVPPHSKIQLYQHSAAGGRMLQIVNPSSFPRFMNFRGFWNNEVSYYAFWQYIN